MELESVDHSQPATLIMMNDVAILKWYTYSYLVSRILPSVINFLSPFKSCVYGCKDQHMIDNG